LQDHTDSLSHSHFRAEGDVEFRSILYIPSFAPFDFYDKYYEKAQNGLKLYVRRVFISDDMKELIPRSGPRWH
jgi:heat shock protein beta